MLLLFPVIISLLPPLSYEIALSAYPTAVAGCGPAGRVDSDRHVLHQIPKAPTDHQILQTGASGARIENVRSQSTLYLATMSFCYDSEHSGHFVHHTMLFFWSVEVIALFFLVSVVSGGGVWRPGQMKRRQRRSEGLT